MKDGCRGCSIGGVRDSHVTLFLLLSFVRADGVGHGDVDLRLKWRWFYGTYGGRNGEMAVGLIFHRAQQRAPTSFCTRCSGSCKVLGEGRGGAMQQNVDARGMGGGKSKGQLTAGETAGTDDAARALRTGRAGSSSCAVATGSTCNRKEGTSGSALVGNGRVGGGEGANRVCTWETAWSNSATRTLGTGSTDGANFAGETNRAYRSSVAFSTFETTSSLGARSAGETAGTDDAARALRTGRAGSSSCAVATGSTCNRKEGTGG